MEISEIIKKYGFENNVCRICKLLGFEDTDQLRNAKFFSQEQTYTKIPNPGLCISNNDTTWRICKVVPNHHFDIDEGYKITLQVCDGSGEGRHTYYQSDFLTLIESGAIIPYEENSYIKHVTWREYITDSMYLVHEADIVVNE